MPHPGRTYAYEFTWRSPVPRLGATHALENPFVFDNLAAAAPFLDEPVDLLGDAPPQGLADAMHGAWVAFAMTGDPGWPQYELEHRVTMRFDVSSEAVDDLAGGERELWEGLR